MSISRPLVAGVVGGALLLAACGGGTSGGPSASPTTQQPGTVEQAPAEQEDAGWPALGKYGCSESVPRLVGGSYEYEIELRGYVVLRSEGGYTDPEGKGGKFSRADGLAEFTGGQLDGATAEPIEGEPDRMFVRIPTDSGEMRWACGLNE